MRFRSSHLNNGVGGVGPFNEKGKSWQRLGLGEQGSIVGHVRTEMSPVICGQVMWT